MTDNTHNTNKPPADDPNLTAYALGELAPGSDVYEQIKARLETDTDAKAFVEQTRAFADQLGASYGSDAAASSGLSDHQQKELAAMIDQQDNKMTEPITPPKRFWLSRPALLAAGLALAAGAAITTVTLMSGPDDPTTGQIDTIAVTGLDQVSKGLSGNVAVDFENAPLSEVFAFLRKQTNVAIETDWDALAKRGVTAKTPVTLKADELVPAGRVLTAALQAAWSRSPHPDPAQWTMTEAGVSIAPQSTLVQARLDATSKLLESDRLSRSVIDKRMLSADTAEVWESDLWNRVLAQRDQAAKAVLAEADVALANAEEAVKDNEFTRAIQQGTYAYRLLGANGTLLAANDFEEPMRRIADLQQAIDKGRIELGKSEIKEAVEKAIASGTTVAEYEEAMYKAVRSLEQQDFLAASNSLVEARTILARDREQIDEAEYERYLGRAMQLMSLVHSTQSRVEAQQLAAIEQQRTSLEANIASESERRKNEEIKNLIKSARQAQLNKDYNKALTELDAAAFLEPDNPAINGLRDMIKDTSIAVESFKIKRERDIEIAGQSLMNIEAPTPYRGIAGYPTDGPVKELEELTESISKIDAKAKTSRPVLLAPNSAPPAPSIVAKPGANLGVAVTDGAYLGGYAGKGNTNTRYQHDVQNYFSLSGSAQGLQGQQRHYWYSTDGNNAPVGYLSNGTIAGAERKKASGLGRKVALKRLSGEALYAEREVDFSTLYAADKLSRYERGGSDDYILEAVVQPRYDQAGKPISRREQLEDKLEKLVAERPLPELDVQKRYQYDTLSIALEDAKTLEKLELTRLEEIKDLQELHEEFQRGCAGVFEIDPQMSRDAFAVVNDNPFYDPAEPGRTQSTFSVDVDTAAYTIARRQLMERNHLPTPGAVRIEEMINYFDYNYDAPVVDRGALEDGVVTQASLEAYEKKHEGFAPFATHIQVADCPWTEGNQLVRIGIKGMEVAQEDRPAAHLTFLLDVSGSMRSPNKLGLVKDSLKLLLDKLNDKDHVSIVVYAGASGLVLENVPATEKLKIEQALDKLRAGGSTAGAAGIQLAYQTAQKHYIDGGVNRVILCTDGDFNVGISGTDALVDLIKSKANPEADADGKRRGVYLSVMGYGMGNLNDAMMEPLTNAGNGNYAYIDTLREATKVMYDQAGASLVTIAKDVKIQVQFDPEQVMAYRLIGYENRVLANEDFDNDKVDAGDIGAGHSVTALYEIVPFPADGGDLGNEGFFEVRHRIEELEQAVALNESLMQTAALNPKQSMKLAASTRMLEQEIMLAGAVLEKLEDEKAAAPEEPVEADIDVDAEAVPAPAAVEPLEDGAMLAVKLRYKPVDAPAEDGTSRLIETSVFADEVVAFEAADDATRFAAGVASFAMQLRSSPHAGDADMKWVRDTVKGSSAHDPGQFKAELLNLIKKADGLMPNKPAAEEPAVEEPALKGGV